MRLNKILGQKQSNLSNIPTFADLAFCVASIYLRQKLQIKTFSYNFTPIRFDRIFNWAEKNTSTFLKGEINLESQLPKKQSLFQWLPNQKMGFQHND